MQAKITVQKQVISDVFDTMQQHQEEAMNLEQEVAQLKQRLSQTDTSALQARVSHLEAEFFRIDQKNGRLLQATTEMATEIRALRQQHNLQLPGRQQHEPSQARQLQEGLHEIVSQMARLCTSDHQQLANENQQLMAQNQQLEAQNDRLQSTVNLITERTIHLQRAIPGDACLYTIQCLYVVSADGLCCSLHFQFARNIACILQLCCSLKGALFRSLFADFSAHFAK